MLETYQDRYLLFARICLNDTIWLSYKFCLNDTQYSWYTDIFILFPFPVIVSPHGMRGRLTGCCPADLVKQVYLRSNLPLYFFLFWVVFNSILLSPSSGFVHNYFKVIELVIMWSLTVIHISLAMQFWQV